MSGKTDPKTSRAGWIAMHGSFLGWALCLMVLAEEHRDGGNPSTPSAETSAGDVRRVAGSDSASMPVWVEKQIEGLGDPVSGVRAKATRQLLAAGSKAVKPLATALSSKDPEVCRQTQFILARLIRGDEESFAELESVACSPNHPSAKAAAGILHRECDRRESVMAALAEKRKGNAHRYLREARAALYQGQFAEARQKALAAEGLDISYNQVDDNPQLVLSAIHQAETRAARLSGPAVITAERE